MINKNDANAMAEVLHYLKGIRQEDIEKIPKKLLKLFEENANKEYIGNFDYNKPLKELDLLDETRGFIAMICLNYWCRTKEEKQDYINKLNQNEIKYQDELRQKYNPDDIFKNNTENTIKDNQYDEIDMQIIEYKEENIFQRIFNKIKNLLKR